MPSRQGCFIEDVIMLFLGLLFFLELVLHFHAVGDEQDMRGGVTSFVTFYIRYER